MRIVHIASEMTPFARTGGLGDVLEALPAALAAAGHEVSVVLPCYRGLREKARDTGVKITVPVGGTPVRAEIWETCAPNGVQVFLVRADGYFDRPALYGEEGRDYEDASARFIFFAKAAVELARRIVPAPDVLHVHDWQAALVPVLVRERRLPFKTVLTIHNLAYQGSFPAEHFGLTNLPGDYFSARGVECYGRLNLLKGGLLFADALTTVSERYAREILTPEQGSGLDGVMREQAGKLVGILNGADYAVWNPATDQLLPERFSPTALAGKRACRDALLAECGLEPEPGGPVLAMVSRLAEQKGIDLLLPLLDRLLADDVRLVILGEGEPAYERELFIASKRHGGRFTYRHSAAEKVAHLAYAGADAFLVPSHFEPCGLGAMDALKYGALPIARATGGLYETIQDYDPVSESGHGFLFYDDTTEALWDAIIRAKQYFADPVCWRALMLRAMACDFAWTKAAAGYEAVYGRVVVGR